ncbi:MAG TPA: TadG family pilus assembly protein, partial [Chlorobaculum sp.]|nr:TadG family pilus assembly protein [Chlorobaculum sp.]
MVWSHNKIKLLQGQRGSVAIWFALFLPVLLGFAALAIDLARLNLAKVELQNAADAAALGGAKSLSVTSTVPANIPNNWTAANTTALSVAQSNLANDTNIQDATITTGYWNINNPSLGLRTLSTPGTGDVPAVRVTVAISSTQNNGPLRLFFGPFLGIGQRGVSATATAISSTSGPFNYGIFSGSQTSPLQMFNNNINVKGSVHTNNDLFISANNIKITGAAEAKGTISTYANTTSIGTRSPNASLIDMPDYSTIIAPLAEAAHKVYSSGYSINANDVTSDPIYVHGSVSVNVNNFNATGIVMADGDININANNVASLGGQVAFYS